MECCWIIVCFATDTVVNNCWQRFYSCEHVCKEVRNVGIPAGSADQCILLGTHFWIQLLRKQVICLYSQLGDWLAPQHIAYEMLMLNQEEHICILADPLV